MNGSHGSEDENKTSHIRWAAHAMSTQFNCDEGFSTDVFDRISSIINRMEKCV